jgi:phosphoglucosamine mutase
LGKLFGTDGVRGVANSELSSELAYQIGRTGGFLLTNEIERPKVVVGMDTRISGAMLEGAVSAGLCSSGIDVLYAGVIPTPAIAYLVRKLGAQGGVMISASHNPVEYNGIKFFDQNGYKLSDEMEESIEKMIEEGGSEYYPTGSGVGRKINIENPSELYMEFLTGTIEPDLSGIKIAVDCANGSAYDVAPKLLQRLGATVYVTHNFPNGLNINVNCGSTYPAVISQFVKDTGADIGLAFDGDADRLIATDENGCLIDGDHIMAICGIYMKNQGRLFDNTIVGTVMSNMGLGLCLSENNIHLVKTPVGDRYVLEEMKSKSFSLGGEQSGHIIFLDYNTTGDGLLTALQLLRVLKEQNKLISQLSSVMKDYPQVLLNAKVNNANKFNFLDDDRIRFSIEELESEFMGRGRVLIRPSGTEPLVRVMLEGENEFEIRQKATILKDLIEERLN